MKQLIAMMLVLALAPFTATAEDVKIPNDGDPPGLRVECDVTGCDLYWMDVNWSGDDTGGPVTFGPLSTAAGQTIANVVLQIDISQTWVGDIVLELFYDADGDGTYDAGPVSALCRPNLAGCEYDGCCGCSGDVIGIYTFGDDAAESLGDPNCPSMIPNGCYLPAPESPAGFAATFGGMATGGDFYIEIADGAGGDVTNLYGWGVYLCGEVPPTAVESFTWGRIKSIYGE